MDPLSKNIVEFAPFFRSCESDFEKDLVLMKSIYALRYKTYCEECAFLPASDYPDGLESDQYDAHSAHFCAFNKLKELVGYVRLVMPNERHVFPFQDHCSTLHANVVCPPQEQSAEISRLMVRQDYRRRTNDTLQGVTVHEETGVDVGERRNDSPQILLSMYRHMYHHSLDHGVRYWYAAMERSLARALTRMGFTFRQIGPQIDYYGPVASYVADLRELEAKLQTTNEALLEWMQHGRSTQI